MKKLNFENCINLILDADNNVLTKIHYNLIFVTFIKF